MFLNEDKELIEKTINESQSETEKYSNGINEALFEMLRNPTDEAITKFRDTRDALLVGMLSFLMTNSSERYYEAAQLGIDEADKQLKSKGQTTVANATIDKKSFVDKVDTSLTSLNQDLATLTDSIKSNSERIIAEIKKKPITGDLSEQKKISTELVAELQEKGITFFTDKIGRKTPIDKYIKMRVFTDSVNIQRSTFFLRSVQYGIDLVRIRHLNIHPQCSLCIPFNNKILSINGATKGYMTVEEAVSYGLFHPNCDHVPEELELSPTDKGGEGSIDLNESNQKRFKYNQKKTVL